MNTSPRKILTAWLSRIVIRTLKRNKLKLFKEIEKINFKTIKLNFCIKKLFQEFETTRNKIVKRQWSLIFVKRSLDINVQSKFYNIIYINCI